MQTLTTADPSFEKKFRKFLGQESERSDVERTVRRILDDVRRQGDRALIRYTARFDRFRPTSLEVTPREIAQARKKIGRRDLAALRLAARRIRNFHRHQRHRSWRVNERGMTVGEIVRPIQRIGIYVPGGRAAYPSTVLMNAIPAAVAGVPEIVMCTPWTEGRVNPTTLAAAELAGVTQIFKIGGAQAIAAMAYGTRTVPAVDKIVGPGNVYVVTAKRLVFGKVGIDGLAGPTEIVVIADDTARPEWVAADLLSQLEHDPKAVAVLITSSRSLVRKVQAVVSAGRREGFQLAGPAGWGKGLAILTRNLAEAVELANRIAPEHLELAVRDPARWLFYIQNAGAIFLGTTPVAFGDYLAGPNHVLPTGGTARFSSPLGVRDFLKSSSLIEARESALRTLGPAVMRLAEIEGLTAHAASVRLRLKTQR